MLVNRQTGQRITITVEINIKINISNYVPLCFVCCPFNINSFLHVSATLISYTTDLKPQYGASIVRVGALPVPCRHFDFFLLA